MMLNEAVFSVFINECRKGDIEKVIYLYNKYYKHDYDGDNTDNNTSQNGYNTTNCDIKDAFNVVCHKGHLHIAKWLYTNPTYEKEIKEYLRGHKEELFLEICENGHLEIAEFIYDEYPDINIHINNEVFFRTVCQYGYTDFAQWLFATFPSIYVLAEKEQAFRFSCENNHLECAQWLYEIEQNNISNTTAIHCYHTVCERGYFKMARWLNSVFSGAVITADIQKEVLLIMSSSAKKDYAFIEWLLENI